MYRLLESKASTLAKVARWVSSKYQTLSMPVPVAQNIELFTHALSGITVIFILDKESKYQTVRLNTGHLATLTIALHKVILIITAFKLLNAYIASTAVAQKCPMKFRDS